MPSDPLILPRCRNWLALIPSRFKSDTVRNGDLVSLTVKRINWAAVAHRNTPRIRTLAVEVDLSDLDLPTVRRLGRCA